MDLNNEKKVTPSGSAKSSPEKKVVYGNREINELHAFLREKLDDLPLDGTIAKNRQFCEHFINKIKKTYPGHNEMSVAKFIIDYGMRNFLGQSMTSFTYLFYSFTKIIHFIAKEFPNEFEFLRTGKREDEAKRISDNINLKDIKR